jgi:hypothetical protein
VKRLNLVDLPTSCPLLTETAGQFMADAAAVCLAEQGHGSEVVLRVAGDFQASYFLERPDVTVPMRASYDVEEATEFGACGVAILVMRDLTGLTVQRAFKGGGFDYWLGTIDAEQPFANVARLEVSGIRRGNRRQIAARVKEKLAQVHRSEAALAAYVGVVEFGAPVVRIEKR